MAWSSMYSSSSDRDYDDDPGESPDPRIEEAHARYQQHVSDVEFCEARVASKVIAEFGVKAMGYVSKDRIATFLSLGIPKASVIAKEFSEVSRLIHSAGNG